MGKEAGRARGGGGLVSVVNLKIQNKYNRSMLYSTGCPPKAQGFLPNTLQKYTKI